MTIIPKLSKNQIEIINQESSPNNKSFFGGLCEDEIANFRFMNALKVADEMSLLTKEASLAIKPDNYINWAWISRKDASLLLGINKIYVFEIIEFQGVYTSKEKWVTIGTFDTLLKAKQSCHAFLENQLKSGDV